MPHLSTFEETSPPDLVISPSYKSSTSTNYAVCYGVRIVLPFYLQTLQGRFNACWKKVADSQDSFELPDQELDEFQPGLDAALPNTRRGVECWAPDKRRRNLFKGWKIFGLRPKVVSRISPRIWVLWLMADDSYLERNGTCWQWARAIPRSTSLLIPSSHLRTLRREFPAGLTKWTETVVGTKLWSYTLRESRRSCKGRVRILTGTSWSRAKSEQLVGSGPIAL